MHPISLLPLANISDSAPRPLLWLVLVKKPRRFKGPPASSGACKQVDQIRRSRRDVFFEACGKSLGLVPDSKLRCVAIISVTASRLLSR